MNAPITILILEDEPLIAMDLELTLQTAGYAVAATLASGTDAESWLEENRADLALVDPELRDGVCEKVASILQRENIPFLICSGRLPNDEALSPAMREAVWLGKPTAAEDLLLAIDSALQEAHRLSEIEHG